MNTDIDNFGKPLLWYLIDSLVSLLVEHGRSWRTYPKYEFPELYVWKDDDGHIGCKYMFVLADDECYGTLYKINKSGDVDASAGTVMLPLQIIDNGCVGNFRLSCDCAQKEVVQTLYGVWQHDEDDGFRLIAGHMVEIAHH